MNYCESDIAELPADRGIEVKLAGTAHTRVRNIVAWHGHNNARRLILLRFVPSMQPIVENVIRIETVIGWEESPTGILVTDSAMLTEFREALQHSTYELGADEYRRLQRWLGPRL